MDERARRTTLSMRLIIGFGVALTGWLLLRFALWFPTEARIRGCLTTTMFEVNLCPGGPNYVPLRNISRNLQHAVVTSEDGKFWSHEGFDLEEIQASFEKNLEAGRYERGGSTITQQLAKNMFLTKNKTIVRKALEILVTLKIESTLSKKEIMERYLNVVQFGDGIFGVKQAAHHYFRKGPAQLSAAESAFLAMLLPNPVKYSRSFKQKKLTTFARKRMRHIIRHMYSAGRLSHGEYRSGLMDIEFFFGNRPADPVAVEPNASGVQSEESVNPESSSSPVVDDDDMGVKDYEEELSD